ncbi:MAG: NAD(P)-dependent oxidoreductase [Magnetococcales bacterium]|nr:NAD(P)-dependent oxidoreductase [Magnetococcales bacterium]
MVRREKSVLITGAGGFIGSHLRHRFAEAGWRVFAQVRRPPAGGVADTTTTFLPGDLATTALPLPKDLDCIVHAAARSPHPGATLEDFFQNNILATRRLIHQARPLGGVPILYLSSLSLYGEITEAVVNEQTPRTNPTPYGISKYWGECLLREEAKNLPAIALRLPGVLGVGAQTPWLAQVADKLKRDAPITLFNPESPFNNAVHVTDLADFILLLASGERHGFDAVTLASSGEISIRQAVALLKSEIGSYSAIEVVPNRQQSFTVSSERARRIYGYAPHAIETVLHRFAQELT